MRTRSFVVALVVLTLLVPVSLFADFQYTETSKITGGAMVKMMKVAGAFSKQARQATEPIQTTVVLKGNRMARISQERTEIIDLDKETFTQIDNVKKTYTVETFQQFKQRMEEAARKASREKKSDEPAPQMSFKVNVRNTNATKQVGGLSTKEAILTMVMEAQDQKSGEKGSFAMTSDMWLAPEIPGYAEVRAFQLKLAEKLGISRGAFSGMLAAMQPKSSQSMAEMAKEMSKLKGVPVLQVVRMGTTTDGKPLAAASEAPLPAEQEGESPDVGKAAEKSAGESVTSGIAGKLGGLGGLGGFGRKKKKEEPKPEQTEEAKAEPAKTAQPTEAVFAEMNMEMTNFSSAPVDGSRFEVPAGYKQIQAKD